MICDLDKIARLFRVTEKAVRDWIAAGMPVHEFGTQGGARKKTRIKLEAAVEWYFRENHERLELDRQRTRLSSEQADRQALENGVRRGELAEREDVRTEWSLLVSNARHRLRAIPTSLGPQLTNMADSAKIVARLRHEIDAALKELAGGTAKAGRR